jgi:glycosyltransferase involved in cell wall biosynthesis
VLLVSDFYPPAPGGLEAHVRRLAHALLARGHDVVVLAGGGGESADDRGVRVHRAGVVLDRVPLAYRQAGRSFHPPWPDPVFRRALTDLLDRFGPDVVHAHGWCQFSAAMACHGRRPLVVTLHDHGLRCPKKNLLRGGRECAHGRGARCLTCPGREQGVAKRAVLSAALSASAPWLATRVARFLAVSAHVARRYAQTLPGRVEVVPNFLDLPGAAFTEPAGTDILYVGPADRHKGLPVLLRAMRHLPESVRLTVAGALGDGGDRRAGVGYEHLAGGGQDALVVLRRLGAAAAQGHSRQPKARARKRRGIRPM